MPGTKEIRVKIASVKSTQKITKAMQMVATSKMRRAQERMRLARPYAAKIRSVIGNLTQANPDYRNPFLEERSEVKNVGIIVISSDRGLCGSLNATTFKAALMAMRDWQAKGASISMSVIGTRILMSSAAVIVFVPSFPADGHGREVGHRDDEGDEVEHATRDQRQ